MTRRRVVITGMGTVNSLGSELPEFWRALCAGKSGISKIELFDTSDFKVHFGGEVKNFNPEAVLDAKTARRLDRFAQLGQVAAISAVKDSGLDLSKEDPYRCGVIVGSGIGGLMEFEEQHCRYYKGGPGKISPFVIPKMIANGASGNISIHFGLKGPNTAVATACASAANAIGDSLRTIQWDYADVMVTGGAEIKGEILGCGCTADAHNITAPHPEGEGAARAMQFALQDARLNLEDIQYVNAHGTSTPLGDEAETRAIKTVFGPHARKLAISSTKSMLGHLLGASGGVELIATALTIRQGVIHPTINYDTPDPACDLDYVPNTARETRVRRAISNSFGFGGHNCCLVVGAFS